MYNFLPITLTVVALTVVVAFFVPLTTHAAGDYGLRATAEVAGLDTNSNLPQVVGKMVGAGLSLLGLVFLGLMLFGGFRWMTARGEEKPVTQAKDTITNAIIGIAIVVGAYAITDFVLKAVTDTGNTCEQSCIDQFPDDQDALGDCALACQGI
ncbi:hypothetical protein A3H75_01975 [Candidatus Uhrbacteria bacterium RIFCSPLOWO2_02_FULL_51_9]|uniref:Uncharacterized protein n=1 Tax=Candidatus Uhrbacteria bacterium RIFCSPLOWO2_02_FULL_51_9 TaxID=1802410 RepID=A0A1F7VFU3_9BACT|nr:MAG: hypothetical protein A3H75_01975 [Candidatus Uhrbacteria bacterium RIFCSPLOWO2_02_FULL_51_9]